MGESKELRPKSFRIDDATADKFKEIATQIGGNQQETLAKLIEAYEFQGGKAVLTEKKADIEQFEKYVNALTRMFMGSLQDNQDLAAIVRTEFEAQLKSKDTVIEDLQEKLQEDKQAKVEAEAKQKSVEEEKRHLEEDLNQLKKEHDASVSNYESKIADLNHVNAAFNESYAMLKKDNERLREDASAVNALQAQVAQLNSDLDAAKISLQEAERSHEQDALKYEHQLMDLEKKYREEKQEVIDKYQAKYLELLEKMQSKEPTSPR